MAQSEIIFDVVESAEGGYEARALGYSIYTQADTLEELKAMVQDAVRCHFDEESRPKPYNRSAFRSSRGWQRGS